MVYSELLRADELISQMMSDLHLETLEERRKIARLKFIFIVTAKLLQYRSRSIPIILLTAFT